MSNIYKKPIGVGEFSKMCIACDELEGDWELDFEIIKYCGGAIELRDEYVYPLTTTTLLDDQIFVFVDIETTGSVPADSSLLEVGAIKYRAGEVLDSFESYVRVGDIPAIIEELTGITKDDVANAPKQREVLEKFRLFLGDSVFVAHNVGFDYAFLHAMMKREGLIGICNPRLCTIDFTHKTIVAPRYGLGFLNEFLEINTPQIHRAYSDALTCMEIFKKAYVNIPKHIKYTQDLIKFTKS